MRLRPGRLPPTVPLRRYDADRQALMLAELERIVAADGLSKDTYEIVRRTLDAAAQPAAV